MYQFILFVHIIAGAVYFALPFTFPRWFRGAAAEDNPQLLQRVAVKLKMYVFVYMNTTALVVLGTGLYMTFQTRLMETFKWPHLAAVLLLASLVNLRLILGSALRRQLAARDDQILIQAAVTAKRISIFEGIHHTLITILIGLMVFRPF